MWICRVSLPSWHGTTANRYSFQQRTKKAQPTRRPLAWRITCMLLPEPMPSILRTTRMQSHAIVQERLRQQSTLVSRFRYSWYQAQRSQSHEAPNDSWLWLLKIIQPVVPRLPGRLLEEGWVVLATYTVPWENQTRSISASGTSKIDYSCLSVTCQRLYLVATMRKGFLRIYWRSKLAL